MPLNVQTEALLTQMAATGAPPWDTLPVAVVRQGIAASAGLANAFEEVAQVENQTIPGPLGSIPVRIYTPAGDGPFPILLFFHGGGFVLGDLDSHDTLCRALTNGGQCITLLVDYRLGPENKFPAAVLDSYAATEWAATNAASFKGDPNRMAVGGDSAGGNLAAVISQMARDKGGPKLVFQLLIYPATDMLADTPSLKDNADGYFVTKAMLDWFVRHYLSSEADKQNPLASPLRASDFSNLPPALVLTAEFDLVRDEGELYAARLKEAGVAVTVHRYDGTIHGFVNFAGVLDQGKAAIAEASTALRQAFAANPIVASRQ